MYFRFISGLCLLAILLTGTPARADDWDDPEKPAEHRISLFISPIALFVGRSLNVGAEFKYRPKLTFVAFGTAGRPSFTLFGVTGQVRRYLIGDFEHGLNIGGELSLTSGSVGSSKLFVTTSGVGVGGFAGYKYIAKFGVTIDANAGVQFYGVGHTIGKPEGVYKGSAVLFGPLLRFNFGWSF